MAHYARVIDGVVSQVIVADVEYANGDPTLIQCSYNTSMGVHYGQDGQPDGGVALRGNYPGEGWWYNEEHDVFTPPKRYDSWTLNMETFHYDPPVPMPTDDKLYRWDEENQEWVERT